MTTQFDEPETVRRLWENVCESDGETIARLSHLEACIIDLEDWFALATIYERLIAISEDEMRAGYLMELARVVERNLMTSIVRLKHGENLGCRRTQRTGVSALMRCMNGPRHGCTFETRSSKLCG